MQVSDCRRGFHQHGRAMTSIGSGSQPCARALWQRSARGSFDEGATTDALSGPDYSATGVRTLAGISAGSANGSPLAAPYSYRINVGVGHNSGDIARPSVTATLAGDDFAITAPDVGRTFGQIDATANARFSKHGYAYVGVSDEVRSGKSLKEGVILGARANF